MKIDAKTDVVVVVDGPPAPGKTLNAEAPTSPNREWWVSAKSCHLRRDGPFASAALAAERAETLLPEDGWKRVWIIAKNRKG